MQSRRLTALKETVSVRGRMPSGKPNPVDVHVGYRIRLRRTLLGLSQQNLGQELGITFQQVQKYESGANRISASRLWDLSRVLNCSMTFFFEDMDDATALASPRNLNGENIDVTPREKDSIMKRETVELVGVYYRITDRAIRRRVFDLTRSLTKSQGGPYAECLDVDAYLDCEQ
jgi:transcriptional regulator with XRE-family HTH domain